MSNKNNKKIDTKDYRKSVMSELSAVSVGAIVLMTAVIILCMGLYIAMNIRPSKEVYVKDDADIFSGRELSDIKKLANDLSEEKDINVVIITTRHKGGGYSNSDEDCKRFAGDVYTDKCIESRFRDNSGICILIDLTLDYSGGRFFWIYTYGTAYFTIDDDECTSIFQRYKSDLSDEEYGDAVKSILDDLEDYNWHAGGLVFTYFFSLVIPAVIALILTLLFYRSKKLDRKPITSRYRTGYENLGTSDRFLKKTVVVSSNSSGGGGGGGGGGGHSGGGGGRF